MYFSNKFKYIKLCLAAGVQHANKNDDTNRQTNIQTDTHTHPNTYMHMLLKSLTNTNTKYQHEVKRFQKFAILVVYFRDIFDQNMDH